METPKHNPGRNTITLDSTNGGFRVTISYPDDIESYGAERIKNLAAKTLLALEDVADVSHPASPRFRGGL